MVIGQKLQDVLIREYAGEVFDADAQRERIVGVGILDAGEVVLECGHFLFHAGDVFACESVLLARGGTVPPGIVLSRNRFGVGSRAATMRGGAGQDQSARASWPVE